MKNAGAFPDAKQFPLPLWIFNNRGIKGLGIAASTGVNGQVNLTAFYTPFQITITRMDLVLAVLGGAGTNLRLGLYSSASQTAPTPDGGSLLFDSGNIVADVTTAKDVAVTPNVVVSGWFYAALETNDATIQYNRYGGTSIDAAQGTEKINGCRFAQAFGALPATVPATTIDLTVNFLCGLRYT